MYTIGLVGLLGSLLVRLRARPDFFSREGFAVVGLIWVFLSLFGALPFWFSGEFASFADCFFEIVSGFTTTGASILTEVESLPPRHSVLALLLLLDWGNGGIDLHPGFPAQGGGRTQVLVQAEATGPVSNKLVPKTALSARILYLIYISLTLFGNSRPLLGRHALLRRCGQHLRHRLHRRLLCAESEHRLLWPARL